MTLDTAGRRQHVLSQKCNLRAHWGLCLSLLQCCCQFPQREWLGSWKMVSLVFFWRFSLPRSPLIMCTIESLTHMLEGPTHRVPCAVWKPCVLSPHFSFHSEAEAAIKQRERLLSSTSPFSQTSLQQNKPRCWLVKGSGGGQGRRF